jgi:hypothetical protein
MKPTPITIPLSGFQAARLAQLRGNLAAAERAALDATTRINELGTTIIAGSFAPAKLDGYAIDLNVDAIVLTPPADAGAAPLP